MLAIMVIVAGYLLFRNSLSLAQVALITNVQPNCRPNITSLVVETECGLSSFKTAEIKCSGGKSQTLNQNNRCYRYDEILSQALVLCGQTCPQMPYPSPMLESSKKSETQSTSKVRQLNACYRACRDDSKGLVKCLRNCRAL